MRGRHDTPLHEAATDALAPALRAVLDAAVAYLNRLHGVGHDSHGPTPVIRV
jgi:hypothetical protein